MRLSAEFNHRLNACVCQGWDDLLLSNSMKAAGCWSGRNGSIIIDPFSEMCNVIQAKIVTLLIVGNS